LRCHLLELEFDMKRSIPSLIVLAAVCVAGSVARGNGNVFVVDEANGPIFDIQTAITLAEDGDTILVKSGTYAAFTVVNESLAIVADTNATVTVSGGAEVRNLAAGRRVVLAGMTINGESGVVSTRVNALYLKNDAGAVRVHCTLNRGTPVQGANIRFAAAMVLNCTDVAFDGCALQGSASVPQYNLAAGLDATSSRVAVYDCTLFGGIGAPQIDCAQDMGWNGGAGARLYDAFLFASGSTFAGGDGGHALQGSNCADQGGDGGDGIVLKTLASGSQARLVDVQLDGGSGGFGGYDGLEFGPPGAHGQPATADAGSAWTVIIGTKRVLTSASLVRDDAPLLVSYSGVPGDEVGVYLAPKTTFQFLPELSGVKLVAPEHPPLVAAWLGPAPTGQLSNVPIQLTLPPGGLTQEYFLQAIVRTPQGTRMLGSPRSITVLDPSY
jgi:hypothetical protein